MTNIVNNELRFKVLMMGGGDFINKTLEEAKKPNTEFINVVREEVNALMQLGDEFMIFTTFSDVDGFFDTFV